MPNRTVRFSNEEKCPHDLGPDYEFIWQHLRGRDSVLGRMVSREKIRGSL